MHRDGCEFIAHYPLCTHLSGSALPCQVSSASGLPSALSSHALPSARPCPCSGPVEQPTEVLPNSHQPNPQTTRSVCANLTAAAWAKGVRARANPCKRAAASGREALRHIWINSICWWLSWACRKAAVRGLIMLPSKASCFMRRHSGRQLMCCPFAPWFTFYQAFTQASSQAFCFHALSLKQHPHSVTQAVEHLLGTTSTQSPSQTPAVGLLLCCFLQ